MSGPTTIDLFAGCGGLTRGFADAGFTHIAANELDLAAASSFAANFGETGVSHGDIADFVDVPQADVVVGGPPCQGFSQIGTRDPDDPRNSLWREYMRVVLEANPQVFVLENVGRFCKSAEFDLLMGELTTGQLKRWKHASVGVVNAADFGVPQTRKRTVIVASRVGPISLPTPTHAKGGADGLEPWVTLRDAIGSVDWDVPTTTLPKSSVEFFGQRVPGVYKGLDVHVGRNPTELSLKRYDVIPPGGGRFDLPFDMQPPCWQNKKTGTTDVMGRLRWEQPSVTIRTEFNKPEKGRYLHPQWEKRSRRKRVNRALTHFEAALVQSFPEDYLWCGTKTQIARQIGNAVPPLLASSIAWTVRASLS
ncbi:MAG: DNA cytosine methyltransferase [Ilumatobacteraceae bacterium]|nr:DNA cytosine methyltransferase [Ilumatobacteraceae bacterium]